ncbi:lactate dehydrogenase [Schaalia odontolytica]
MTSHDFEVDLEALGTAVSQLSDLQERNRTYDVADYTPNSGMVADPVVVRGLDSFNTKWDQGLNGMLRDISEAAGRLGKVTGIYADYMAACDEAMTRARDAAAAISTEPLVKGI